ncbi:MAG: hypothetical protein HON04_06870, partial [Planctomicrobium sp.]|nr:hypothetical protein [Planctomicrobium sp.]
KKTLSDKFATPKGSWKVVDGVLVGKELKSDKHAAVLSYQQPNRNSLIQFSFMLDGTKGFHLSFNHAKGHLFRVIVDTESVAIRTDKDKKDPKSEPLTISQTKSKIAEGEWHTMLVEIIDDQVLVQFDEGPTIIGLHPSLAVDKPNYRFVMRGESLKIDDLKIWAAE